LQQPDASTDLAESHTALADLFREQRLPLRQFLMGLLRNQAEADDVLAQVFLKLVENWATMRLDTAKSWLFTVAYHEALAVRRRRIRQEAALAELWAQPVWLNQAIQQASPSADAVRREEIETVQCSLAALPTAQREVVERRVYRNQTFQTIADEMGCPLGTILSRMRLALKALSHLLEE
jgi:RNA polymerase sigma factor (sigma-70 family)